MLASRRIAQLLQRRQFFDPLGTPRTAFRLFCNLDCPLAVQRCAFEARFIFVFLVFFYFLSMRLPRNFAGFITGALGTFKG